MLASECMYKKDTFIYTKKEVRAYIPMAFFDKKIADVIGETIHCFGIFPIIIKDVKSNVEIVSYPSMINLYPSETKTVSLDLFGDGIKTYRELYFPEETIFTDLFVKQDSANGDIFLNLLLGGKLPNFIPYMKIIDVWKLNAKLNGLKLGVPDSLLEIVIREICRVPGKNEEFFGKLLGENPKMRQIGYDTLDSRSVCANNTTFAGITFEDFNRMLGIALIRNKRKTSENNSAMEQILKV